MSELLDRYRRHYGISDDVVLTHDHLRRHLAVEMEVTRELLASSEAERAEVFAHGYARIYRELWWFNATDDQARGAVDISGWVAMIGPPPRRVLEVGAGQGALARALARAGYDVVANDISAERGGRRDGRDGVEWHDTDGVDLTRFEQPESYDAVISDQVVEHLHPDDVPRHLRSARRLLRHDGRYVFRTPHGPSGPYDSSLAFGLPVALGTHLREYSFASRVASLRAAGYQRVLAERPRRGGPKASEAYAHYLCAAEQQLLRLPPPVRRPVVKTLLRDRLLFRRNAILAGVR